MLFRDPEHEKRRNEIRKFIRFCFYATIGVAILSLIVIFGAGIGLAWLLKG